MSRRLTTGNRPACRIDRRARRDGAGDVGIGRAQARQPIGRRLRDQAADRMRKAEGGGVDGAERRRQRMGARALRDILLADQQRGEILIADLRRHQTERQNAEAEGADTDTLRPVTRRNHAQLTQLSDQRNATRRHTYAMTPTQLTRTQGVEVTTMRHVLLLSDYPCEAVNRAAFAARFRATCVGKRSVNARDQRANNCVARKFPARNAAQPINNPNASLRSGMISGTGRASAMRSTISPAPAAVMNITSGWNNRLSPNGRRSPRRPNPNPPIAIRAYQSTKTIGRPGCLRPPVEACFERGSITSSRPFR